MSEIDQSETEPQELGFLERAALRAFRRWEDKAEREAENAVHVLDQDEQKALRGIQRGVVFRAALIGALTASIAAAAEVWLETRMLGGAPDAATFSEKLHFWLALAPVIGIAAVLEIGLLYWDGLRSVHRLSKAAGLVLFDGPAQMSGIALALARAALELPNPQTGHGIDAHREVSKLWLLSVGLLYKAKVGLTSFLVKALIRRAAGRSLVRAWLIWAAVPVTAVWDAIVAYRMIREARLRAIGPSAAEEIARALFEGDKALSSAAEQATLQAVGSCIVSTHDAHPNLLALLDALERRVTPDEETVLDSTSEFMKSLEALSLEERRRVLEVAVVAAVLDGKLSGDERAMIQRAQAICQVEGLAGVERLRKSFVKGRGMTERAVERAIGTPIRPD